MYNHKEIESKWQKFWADNKLYQAKDDSKKPKFYQLETFPYPSAAGLHVGHPKGYIAEDIHARFTRANGKEVLYTMGWDAFGLPTENYAIKVGKNPKEVAAENIANFKRQVQMFGLSYDWDREINTSSPDYYKWTQWLFIQLYKKGLAYRAKAKINWCPNDQTVLANEQVIDGKCDRCGTVVIQKEMEQWFLKITDYADRLLADLDGLDWPEATKQMQKNWIGRSEGADIDFKVDFESEPNFLILHGYTGLPGKNFIPWLKQEIESKGYKVQAPEMPNSNDPKEEEQVNFVLQNCKIDKNTIIVGHSLGCVVAQKVLMRHNSRIMGLILIASATDKTFPGSIERPFWKNFSWDIDYEKVKELTKFRTVVSDLLEDKKRGEYLKFLKEKLGSGFFETTASKQHFTDLQEPELLKVVLPKIKVFTTRPDTIFGATYMVLAPEHPLVSQITTKEQKNYVVNYVESAAKKTELERTALEKDKTGVFTGAFAINPATKDKIQIWVADYVLSTYGSGAIMAVPAHDERDFEFAKKFELPIVRVVNDEGDRRLPYTREGRIMNSGKYNDVSSSTIRSQMAKDFGTPKVQYRLRDWSISRQRYWGVPIPMINCEKCGIHPVPEKDLPVVLPDDVDFRPKGMPPLASSEQFLNVSCPNCGGPAKREPETLDTFFDSSWYYLRYTDPHNDQEIFEQSKVDHWMPVDLYVIGPEHATLHLLYSRFLTKFLFDAGFVKVAEPFNKLRHLGLIQGADGQKMSKSRGNVVNPDEVVESVGADSMRIYEMFMGPFEDGQPWNTKGLIGARRFLDKVFRTISNEVRNPSQERSLPSVEMGLHKLIKKITSDIPNFKFNTSIAAFMEFLNENKQMSKANWETFLILLAPFAPHITEELWSQLGQTDSIHTQPWPKFDEKMTEDKNVKIVVQVLGRVRATLDFPVGTSQDEVRLKVIVDPNVKRHLEGKQIVKEIFVQDKLINFVVK